MSEKNSRNPAEQMSAGRRIARAKQSANSRRRERKDRRQKKRPFPYFLKIIIAAAVAFSLVFFIGFRVTINGDSMSRTLTNGQSVLVNRLIYLVSSPKEGDIIVFSTSGNKNDRSSFSVKRVVGRPGEKITIKEEKLYINGEKYSAGKGTVIENAGTVEDGVTVGDNEYFVLGDNPSASEDSRFSNIGCVPKKNIVGKVWLRISPRSAFGRIK